MTLNELIVNWEEVVAETDMENYEEVNNSVEEISTETVESLTSQSRWFE